MNENPNRISGPYGDRDNRPGCLEIATFFIGGTIGGVGAVILEAGVNTPLDSQTTFLICFLLAGAFYFLYVNKN